MFWTQIQHKLQKWFLVCWRKEISWAKATMLIWTITTAAQIYFLSSIIRNVLRVGHAGKIRKICQKLWLMLNCKRKGDCVFRRDGPLLCLKWWGKKDLLRLSTIHEAIFVKTGKVNREGNKIEKPEAVYYYCTRMGGVDLSDQLLNYFTFLRKNTKWSWKLLIHEGLKCYKILSHQSSAKKLAEIIPLSITVKDWMNGTLLQTFQEVKGEREKDQWDAVLFVVNCPV